MKKHAFLIMAHNHVGMLRKILKLLDDERNDIYIHWDRSGALLNEPELASGLQYSTLRFVPQIKVNWGGYSQIACELLLLEQSIENGPYEYYHLLSGCDMPLKTTDYMHTFFDEHKGTQFITIYPNPSIFILRCRYYYLFQDIYGRNKKKPHLAILYLMDVISLWIQQRVGVNRFKHEERTVLKGDQWFSITEDCVRFVLSEKAWIHERFRMTKACDELFLPMLLCHSKYRDAIFQNGLPFNGMRGSLRLIDWNRGKPYVWLSDNFDELAASPCLFARKFDPNLDSEIIDRIYSHVLAQQPR